MLVKTAGFMFIFIRSMLFIVSMGDMRSVRSLSKRSLRHWFPKWVPGGMRVYVVGFRSYHSCDSSILTSCYCFSKFSAFRV